METSKFTTRLGMVSGLLLAATLVGACSSAASSGGNAPNGGGAYGGGAAQTAAGATAAVGASGFTVVAKTIGSQTILVAGSNGMTVYTFSKDSTGSSACTGGCLVTWPALTVTSGVNPAAGSGVGGQLGTITRPDNGKLQVTYNGLPLYFYSGDTGPGDTNGSYPNWNLVKP
jgi:predicted lipoprotein with Yx(FWY)xxD motif